MGPPPEIEEGPLNDSVSIETAHEDENPPASNDVPKPPLKIKEGARPPKNPAPRDRAPPTRSASKPSAQRRQTFVTHKKPGPTPVKHVPTFNLGRKAKATPELINFSVAPSPKTTVDQLISLSDDEHLKHLHEVIQPKTVDNQLINLHDSVEIPNENANPNSKSNVADLLGLEDALIPSTTSEKLSCT